MAEVRLADAKVPGPWLLSRESLLELESTISTSIDEAAAKRQAALEELVITRIAEEKTRIEMLEREYIKFIRSMNDPDFEEKKKARARESRSDLATFETRAREELVVSSKVEIQAILSDGTRVTAATLDDLLAEPAIISGLVTKLEFKASASVPWRTIEESDFDISVECPDYRDRLVVEVSARSTMEENRALSRLLSWAESNQPEASVRWWRRLSEFPFWIPVPFVYLVLLTIMMRVATGKSAAREILQSGVSDDNRDRALELLLAKQYELGIGEVPAFPTALTIAFAGIFAASILIAYPPRTTLGMGRGTKHLTRQRGWAKTVLAIPGFVVGSIVIPWLVESIR